ncbi:Electron transfer flavoprotein-ubiquinone oxidoreductase [Nitrospira tepida]|uniref:Electron transfer flavoprotein-ubiquinone oxidoreductase n=1 Tax=Nitrospira tepida TaxID=2973512 RepID=A0AA86MUJ2_9BACT|nr:electron-transfer flavoprotein:ubiquinone oxidoreductase [Nitrospira tepida]CAI4029634.1 Electron transfer flavoprotein-ubiquinone oxidoreductase [Nitrospira tepida]
MDEALQILEVDILFVGGGPANLSGALRLTQLIANHNALVSAGETSGPPLAPRIALIEKGRDVGAHAISGAIFDPIALEELLPDYRERGFPFSLHVTRHGLRYLTTEGSVRLPNALLPPSDRQDHCYIGSLQKLNLWLAEQVEAAGVYLFPETCGVQILYDGTTVRGVQTGAKGLDAGGGRKANYEPGTDIHANITVFGEGPYGTLAEDLIHRFKLREGRHAQSYALGVKEVIRVKSGGSPGLAMHTIGYPLGSRVFGGGFCYGLDENLFAVGMVCGLDWDDPQMDVHAQLQRLKKHPFIQQFIKGGEVIAYGAKTLPEGGYFAVPRPYVDGALLVGDSAGLLNVPYLKGIHYAMKSGMLAADTIFNALLHNDASAAGLSSYEARLASSYVIQDLYRVRNFRRAFAYGRLPGLLLGGLTMWTGLGPSKPAGVREDFRHLRPLDQAARGRWVSAPARYDAGVLVDKLTDVYHSGTQHREDQPSHIQILDPTRCLTDCIARFGDAPCTHFCPAGVYEVVGERAGCRIQINFANCVHCKTCVIKDPIDVVPGDQVQNIVWRAPAEGGPRYQGL